MLPTSAGSNLRPPGLQSDGVSNWVTEAGGIWRYTLDLLTYFFLKQTNKNEVKKEQIKKKKNK